jgi:Cys-rich repeat protein
MLFFATWALLANACGAFVDDQSIQCTTDADCPSGHVCDINLCEAEVDPPGDAGALPPDAGSVDDAGPAPDAGPIPDAGFWPDAALFPDAGPDGGGVFVEAGIPLDAGPEDEAGNAVDGGMANDSGALGDGAVALDSGVEEPDGSAGTFLDSGLSEGGDAAGVAGDAGLDAGPAVDPACLPDGGNPPAHCLVDDFTNSGSPIPPWTVRGGSTGSCTYQNVGGNLVISSNAVGRFSCVLQQELFALDDKGIVFRIASWPLETLITARLTILDPEQALFATWGVLGGQLRAYYSEPLPDGGTRVDDEDLGVDPDGNWFRIRYADDKLFVENGDSFATLNTKHTFSMNLKPDAVQIAFRLESFNDNGSTASAEFDNINVHP